MRILILLAIILVGMNVCERLREISAQLSRIEAKDAA